VADDAKWLRITYCSACHRVWVPDNDGDALGFDPEKQSFCLYCSCEKKSVELAQLIEEKKLNRWWQFLSLEVKIEYTYLTKSNLIVKKVFTHWLRD
jgi:hypothetical protein